jgi:hypothetical protein
MHKIAMGRMGFGGDFGGWGGQWLAGYDSTDMEAELAEALGITVEQLRSARETAFANTVDQAVAAGELAPKQAERMRAWHGLRPYLNPTDLAARVLEMTPEQLRAAFERGQTLWDLAAERHLDWPGALGKLRTAFLAAVQQAVADGAITQEQAAEIRQWRGPGAGRGPMGFLGRHGCGHDHGFAGMWGGSEPGSAAPDVV